MWIVLSNQSACCSVSSELETRRRINFLNYLFVSILPFIETALYRRSQICLYDFEVFRQWSAETIESTNLHLQFFRAKSLYFSPSECVPIPPKRTDSPICFFPWRWFLLERTSRGGGGDLRTAKSWRPSSAQKWRLTYIKKNRLRSRPSRAKSFYWKVCNNFFGARTNERPLCLGVGIQIFVWRPF